MKRTVIGLVTTYVVLSLMTGSLWAAGPVKLKFATFEPRHGFLAGNVFIPWAEKVSKDGKGILEIEVYAGGTLGRDPEKQLKLVTDGMADMSFIPNPYYPGRFPYDLVANVPYTAKTAMEASFALKGLYERGMLNGYDDVVVLTINGQSQYGIHTTFPVEVPLDLKGKKIRTAGKMQHALVQRCGAAPVAIPIPGTAEAISRGVVRGTISEWAAMENWRIKDVTKYHCMVSFGTNPISVLMNKKKYQSLPPQARAILDNHMGEPFMRFLAGVWDGFADEVAEKVSHDPRHTVYIPSPSEMKLWRTVFAPVIEAWENEDPRRGEVLRAYKEEIAKFRAR